MPHTSESRRRFLQSTAGAALVSAAEAAPALPKVKLGKFEITRLIIGANPLYGYSHCSRLLDQHLREWCTQERVCEILRGAERNGINTWQMHYGERPVSDLKRHRAEGGKLQWILLGMGEVMKDFSLIREMARMQPVGIVHHGNMTDDRFRAGEREKVHDFLKAVRDSGVLVGLSTHNPAVIDTVEGLGWDIDFYMTCLYQQSRPREELQKMLGEAPIGETYLDSDPPRMFRVIRQTKKTCLAFKLLAAGRLINSPQMVEQAVRRALENIKPQDCIIMGMYPRFRDEPRENAETVRRILGAAG
ncbi:MAG: hypothetical protein IT158_02130 [Bryobacterales bacterium]|nr:hypothetical protein [Bryobacterales bacterium]